MSMCHNAFFSSRSEQNISFDVDIVVKSKSKYGLAWSVVLSMIRIIAVVKICCGLTQLRLIGP